MAPVPFLRPVPGDPSATVPDSIGSRGPKGLAFTPFSAGTDVQWLRNPEVPEFDPYPILLRNLHETLAMLPPGPHAEPAPMLPRLPFGEPGQLAPAPRLPLSQPALAAPAPATLADRLATEARLAVANARDTAYEHRDDIDPARGRYRTDCSGLVNFLLKQVDPALLGPLARKRPVARTYYRHFAAAGPSAHGDTSRAWGRVLRGADLRPGDIIAREYTRPRPGATGHVLVVTGRPIPVMRDGRIVAYDIEVVDATRSPHRNDTRKRGGPGGVGRGIISVQVDEQGRIVDYATHYRKGHDGGGPVAVGRIEEDPRRVGIAPGSSTPVVEPLPGTQAPGLPFPATAFQPLAMAFPPPAIEPPSPDPYGPSAASNQTSLLAPAGQGVVVIPADARVSSRDRSHRGGPLAGRIASETLAALERAGGVSYVYPSDFNGDREVVVHASPSFDPRRPHAVLLYNHGKGGDNATSLEAHHLADVVEELNRAGRNILLVMPKSPEPEPMDAWFAPPEDARAMLDQAIAAFHAHTGVPTGPRRETIAMGFSAGGKSLLNLYTHPNAPRIDLFLLADSTYGNWAGALAEAIERKAAAGTAAPALAAVVTDHNAARARKQLGSRGVPVAEMPRSGRYTDHGGAPAYLLSATLGPAPAIASGRYVPGQGWSG